MAEHSSLSEPRSRRHRLLSKVTLNSEAFGGFAEAAVRFMETGKFIAYMTVFVGTWVIFNVADIYGFSQDPHPFILLSLFFSMQASYSASLILLVQNRRKVRNKPSLGEDRHLTAQSRADMDPLAHEIAATRMYPGGLATRDFTRPELRPELCELTERLEQAANKKREEL